MTDFDSFLPARWFHTGRGGKAVRLLVAHCTVSGETGTGAEAVAKYFARGERKASAHAVGDNNTVVGCVHDTDTAFAAAGANNDGWHFEFVGQPQQTAAEWDDDFSRDMLRRAAPYWRERALAWGVPMQWLTVAQVAAGEPGFCTHDDISKAFPNVSTGHWDPGPSFPKADFLTLVRTGTPSQEDDMTPGESKQLQDTYIGQQTVILPTLGRLELAVWQLAQHTGAKVDTAALVDGLAEKLGPLLADKVDGLDAEDVKAAVRDVLLKGAGD